MIRKFIPILGFILVTAIFFWQFLLRGLLPIPADTIIGLYHPYRDFYAKEYPNGIPFKNFLITDPVRQQYPWRNLSIKNVKELKFPSWNPYSFSGTPNFANFQSAIFYPLNIFFFILPFNLSWSFLIMLEPFLAGLFLYYYLRSLKLDEFSSFFGGIVFAFSGFFVTWLEWGTVLHVALWLPLIFLSVDKILVNSINDKYKFSIFNYQFSKYMLWFIVLIFSLVSSFFAGHLQTFFYIFLVYIVYILIRFLQFKNKKFGFLILVSSLIVGVIISLQLFSTLNFIFSSARNVDQLLWQKEGWFIPWQHLIQVIIPDFFGNPTTLNYWGTWNYGELTMYAGVLPLILGIFALFFRKDKKTLFFGTILFLSLIFSLPTIFAKIPYMLNLPFISTAQPTRLIFLIDFSLAILSALGLNYLLSVRKVKEISIPIISIFIIFILTLLFIISGQKIGGDLINLEVAKRNIILPMAIFIISSILILLVVKLDKKYTNFLLLVIILVTIFDLFRFSWKFNTFSENKYLFPTTKSIEFMEMNIGNYRIGTNDSRILPPNFSVMYRLQTVEGYDPLYLLRYGELISAINRGKPDISSPFGFNRIVRVENYNSKFIDLLGIKYVLSLSDINNPKFEKVFEEGETKIYENKSVIPRTFFVKNVEFANDKNSAIAKMFDSSFNFNNTAIVETKIEKAKFNQGSARIKKYSENKIEIETDNPEAGFLVLTDSFYPTWRVKIDDNMQAKIIRTDYNFRGVIVPKGKHKVIFYNSII